MFGFIELLKFILILLNFIGYCLSVKELFIDNNVSCGTVLSVASLIISVVIKYLKRIHNEFCLYKNNYSEKSKEKKETIFFFVITAVYLLIITVALAEIHINNSIDSLITFFVIFDLIPIIYSVLSLKIRLSKHALADLFFNVQLFCCLIPSIFTLVSIVNYSGSTVYKIMQLILFFFFIPVYFVAFLH